MESMYDPKAFDDLEIVISSATREDGYMAHIRLTDGKTAFTKLKSPPSSLEKASHPLTYGEQLFQWLFPPESEVATLFKYARDLASESTRGFKSGVRLRLRLILDSASEELRELLWESLYARDGSQPFSLTTAFSRFMHGSGPHNLPVRKRPLRMLLVISGLQEVDRFPIDEFDPEIEESIIKEATRPIRPILRLDSLKESPTLARIQAKEIQALSEDGDGYHIVHLLAPAIFDDDQGYLLLPDDSGQAQKVAVNKVADTITKASPSYSPPLVFLAMPLAAPRQGSGTLISLAQKLIEDGVHAVVAIQSPISTEALLGFIKRFYAALMRTGVIDVAMAEARTAIYNPASWEWTHPVLYMRVPDGRLFQPLPEELEREITGIT